jgi:hypothetical protein
MVSCAHMAIRLRRIDGYLIAVCAARTEHEPGDLYLDDEAHHALTTKFAEDFNNEGFGCDDGIPEDAAHNHLRAIAEDNNPARSWWDSVYRAN